MEVPEQRSSPDRRTVLLPDASAVHAAVVLAEATGWHLAQASRTRHGVVVVLQR